MAALYAATYPERTRALILFHPFAYAREGHTDAWRARLAELRDRWGSQGLSGTRCLTTPRRRLSTNLDHPVRWTPGD